MAFQKTIVQIKTGVSADYWRYGGLYLDAIQCIGRMVLLGYVNSEVRIKNPKDGAIQSREFILTPSQYLSLVSSSHEAGTLFNTNAAVCYNYIAAAKRTIPVGAIFDPDAQTITVPETGEVVQAVDIDFDAKDEPMFLPSEFADAIFV